MTDLLEPVDTNSDANSDTAEGSPTPPPVVDAFPPPPPGSKVADAPRRRLIVLTSVLAIAGVVAAAVMTVMWADAQNERDAAIAERDAAISERDAAVDAAQAAEADRLRAETDLDAANAEVARLEEDLATGEAALIASEAANGELTAEVDGVTTENSTLATTVAELRAELEAAAGLAGPVPFVAVDHPELSRYVGEVLSSRIGSSPLTPDQSRCFGGTVVMAVGLDGLGGGLHNAATSEANDALVGAMQSAASTCGIDPSLIFG